MFNVDTTKLNSLERKVIDTLVAHAKESPAPTITQAAELCACSPSQVSKAIKKAGFSGYKQYVSYLYHGNQPKTESPKEIERLKRSLADFDQTLVEQFVELINRHEKIILFGYGPSQIVAQYFEYKLRLCVSAFIATPPDEQTVSNMVDDTTLLAIFSTTGQYKSFEGIFKHAKSRGSDVVVISEEFNPLLMETCDRYLVLTQYKQPDSLKPYEKTRTLFFIFIEQVIQEILAARAQT